MSKLGAICDKLRQNGHITTFDELTDEKGHKPNLSPVSEEKSVKPNKRKNFRPTNVGNRLENGETPSKTLEELPSSFADSPPTDIPETADSKEDINMDDEKSYSGSPSGAMQTSVIVRNPIKRSDSPRSSHSGSESSAPVHSPPVPGGFMYNGFSPTDVEGSNRLLNAFYGGAPGLFRPPQYFPFIRLPEYEYAVSAAHISAS